MPSLWVWSKTINLLKTMSMSLISKQETFSLLNKQFKVEYGRKLGSKQETLPLLSN